MRVDLDAAIDIVARQMTEFEPSGALKARVFERIEQRRRDASPGVPRWAWAGAAAAVLLAVAAAVWVVRPAPVPGDPAMKLAQPRGGTRSVEVASAARDVKPTAVTPGPEAVLRASATVSKSDRGVTNRAARIADADAFRDAHQLPAIAEIEPLRFSEVEPHPLQIAAVEVAPLAAMPSIEIPSLGPGSNDIHTADPKKEK